jgi:aryl-alcohol dehydrogenase-like predicted oxidoreductase
MMSNKPQPPSRSADPLVIGGDLRVNRLGFGAMRIIGPGALGEPADRANARAVLHRAVALGVTFIDTADSYGPGISEDIIAEALHPYPLGLVIATKGGFVRRGRGWIPNGRPAHLREAAEGSLRRLRLNQIDLYQLHTVDPFVPIGESVGTLIDLQTQGKIRHIGVSNVSVEELARARSVGRVVSVQNRYSLSDRESDAVVEACERDGLAFLPWYPLATGALARRRGGHIERIARARGATPAQIALAWLLERSPTILPIPGTSSIAHLEENVAAAAIHLSPEEFAALAS